jgi:chromosome segregation ATPase
MMPIELPEDSPDSEEKKWRYRKPGETLEEPVIDSGDDSRAEPIEEPEEEPTDKPTTELVEDTLEEEVEEALEIPAATEEQPQEEVEEEAETVEDEITSLQTEIKKAKREDQEISNQVENLQSHIEEINTEKKALTKEITTLTKQLDKVNTDNTEYQEQITKLQEKLQSTTQSEKEKTKKLKETKSQLSESQKTVTKLEGNYKALKKTAKEREEHLLTQLEAMAEQIGKLREVVKKRDDELVTLQKDILVKKDLAQDAQEEVSQLRTVGIVQREAVQDTTVLRRRVTDLEVELEQLKKALEKDPKYRIYMLVRETGQRTLEELSKILGVGVYEARRRVQELVRAGLLELKGETVTVSRRIK